MSLKDLSLLDWLKQVALFISVVVISGCAANRTVNLTSSVFSAKLEKDIEHNQFQVEKGVDVIGSLAFIRLEKGDSLPDVARHYSLGINAVSAANPGVDLWVPEAGERILLPLRFILPDAERTGIVVNLATMRLFQFKSDGKSLVVSTYPVGVGTNERPTPTGQMQVKAKATRPAWRVPASIAEDHRKKGDPLPRVVPPGPQNPLGECALYLSKAGYLIHGTNKPASIGLKATNGCLRLYPENVKMLYDQTPVSTPVVIVNQPYLIGQQNGLLYLEAHKPQEGSVVAELEKLFARLRDIERKSGRRLNWRKLNEVLDEARGIPVAILELTEGAEKEAARIVEIEHPEKLYGSPDVPELIYDGWYVLAADMTDETDALRTAAIINHQGPPIPARILSKAEGYHVIAGPFNDVGAAKDAVKRLKIDLGLDGLLIDPIKKVEPASNTKAQLKTERKRGE